jgi:hypothetical protein
MTERILNEQVKLANVRIAYPKVFKAEQYVSNGKPSGKPRFSLTMLVEPGTHNFNAVNKAILAAATAKWGKDGEKKLKALRGNSNKFCFLDGDAAEQEWKAGKWVLTAHRNEDQGRPGVYDRDKSPLTESDGKIQSGSWCNVVVEIWAQDGENSGIRCKLTSLQFVKEDDAIGGGGRRPTADDFDEVEEESVV